MSSIKRLPSLLVTALPLPARPLPEYILFWNDNSDLMLCNRGGTFQPTVEIAEPLGCTPGAPQDRPAGPAYRTPPSSSPTSTIAGAPTSLPGVTPAIRAAPGSTPGRQTRAHSASTSPPASRRSTSIPAPSTRNFDFDFEGNQDVMVGFRHQSAGAPPPRTEPYLGNGDGSFQRPTIGRDFPTTNFGTSYAIPQRLCTRFPITP